MVNVLKLRKPFSFCSQIKFWLSRLEFTKCQEQQKGKARTDCQKQSYVGLGCLSWPFWQATTKLLFFFLYKFNLPGRVAQSVTCLATDACLTADPGVASSTPVRSHTFVEIDHEMISTVILLPSADLFKKGCCQLQAKVCARITG